MKTECVSIECRIILYIIIALKTRELDVLWLMRSAPGRGHYVRYATNLHNLKLTLDLVVVRKLFDLGLQLIDLRSLYDVTLSTQY